MRARRDLSLVVLSDSFGELGLPASCQTAPSGQAHIWSSKLGVVTMWWQLLSASQLGAAARWV